MAPIARKAEAAVPPGGKTMSDRNSSQSKAVAYARRADEANARLISLLLAIIPAAAILVATATMLAAFS